MRVNLHIGRTVESYFDDLSLGLQFPASSLRTRCSLICATSPVQSEKAREHGAQHGLLSVSISEFADDLAHLVEAVRASLAPC